MTKRDIKRIVQCLLGGLLLAAVVKNFALAAGLIPAGFSGLTILTQNIADEFAGVTLPYGPIYLLFNLPAIILAFVKIGKKFTIYSCLTIVTVGLCTDFMPTVYITDNVLLLSIFGGVLNGFAVSICLLADATSGGTDFVAIFLSERLNRDAWKYIFIFNVVVLTCAGLLFGWEMALYSIIFQFISTEMIQYVYRRYKKNTLFIITNKPEEVAETISRMTKHGATRIDATGMYDETKRSMIYSVIDSDELRDLIKEIKKTDPDAFINSVKTDHLSGRYFMRPND